MKVISFLMCCAADGMFSGLMILLGVVLLLGTPVWFMMLWRTCSKIGTANQQLAYDSMQT